MNRIYKREICILIEVRWVEIPSFLEKEGDEVLVYKMDTWGSYGQHSAVYCFIIDPEQKTYAPVHKVLITRYEKSDSNKNLHRKSYVKIQDLLSLKGKIIKIIKDYQTASKRQLTIKYFLIDNGFIELKSENLRDQKGFYDKLILSDRILIIRKDSIE